MAANDQRCVFGEHALRYRSEVLVGLQARKRAEGQRHVERALHVATLELAGAAYVQVARTRAQ